MWWVRRCGEEKEDEGEREQGADQFVSFPWQRMVFHHPATGPWQGALLQGGAIQPVQLPEVSARAAQEGPCQCVPLQEPCGQAAAQLASNPAIGWRRRPWRLLHVE